ncbi:DUF2891 domain-containing protein [Niveibacterium sp. 24ML]|uniref:DUF2891 domain-containing protein n=1 Tax=Niveibacterium sp. 24ML TaxID=2985512 RepID=UPI0022721997|nr:DUF2891 domain-containing protein [Niveibacterium sp. 24ML]MCX9157712.1 DUF2891 domain-containing protein [Niveibacterium sp. 24ML]
MLGLTAAAAGAFALPRAGLAGVAAEASLTLEMANRFSAVALNAIQTEFPNKLDHVMAGPADVQAPRAQHPIFYGSFDWHSSVHGHWMLIRLLRTQPALAQADAIRAVLEGHFAPANVAVELAYLQRPESSAFERPYGWGWYLRLAQDLAQWDDPQGRRWSQQLQPLTDAFVARFIAFLPKLVYPIRVGTHTNSALALGFALDFARATNARPLEALIVQRARDWYAGDTDAAAHLEPSGYDFLSPALIEADLMRRVMPADEFSRWLGRFLRGIEQGKPATLFTPGKVLDRTDGHLVHLDGLNLSRAWCWRAIAAALPQKDPRRAPASRAARLHAEAGLAAVLSGHYAGEHWLPQFATYLLTETP